MSITPIGARRRWIIGGCRNFCLDEYVRGDAHTNNLVGWFSLLKRGVNGTFHHVSEEYLDRYAGEFVFRLNNCKVSDYERTVKAIRGIVGKRLVYKEAIKKAG